MGPSMAQQHVAAGSSPVSRSYMQQASKNAAQKRNSAVPFVRPTPFGGPSYGSTNQQGMEEAPARPARTSFTDEQRSQPQQGHPFRSSFAWMPAELANERQEVLSGSPGSSLRRPYSLPANSAVSFFRRTEGFEAPAAEEARPAMVTFTREPSLQRLNSGQSSLTRQLSSQPSGPAVSTVPGPAAHAACTTAIRTQSFSFDADLQKVGLVALYPFHEFRIFWV